MILSSKNECYSSFMEENDSILMSIVSSLDGKGTF